MAGKLVSMALTEIESDRTTLEGYYWSDITLTLETIVKIVEVQFYYHEENSSYQISIDGLALDGSGEVFPINLNYATESKDEKNRLLQDLKKDLILRFNGDYGILPDSPLTMNQPEYFPLESKELEEDVKLSFKHNTHNLKLYKY